MEKVLPGTSHAVLAFIRQRWADLLQVTLLPVAIVVALGVAQYLAMQPLFSSVFDMLISGQINPQIVGRLMQFYGFLALAGMLVMLVFVWLYVRIVRLYAFGENHWVGLNGTVIKATLMTLVYGIGIYLLTVVAYVAAVLAVTIPAAIIGALVYFVIAIPVMVLAMWPMISDFTELARTAESGRFPPEAFQKIMSRMVPAKIVMGLVQIPWMWFSALLFAEAYRRFTARQVTRRP